MTETTQDPGSAGVYLGVWQVGAPQNMAALTRFEQDTGKHAAIVHFWRSMGGAERVLDSSWLTSIADHGSAPMISWSPKNWDGGVDQKVFDHSYAAPASFRSLPIMIAETASSEASAPQTAKGDSKAQWISEAYGQGIPSMPRIKAVVWFNEDKREMEHCACNWPIESSPVAQRAFKQAVQDPDYLSSYP